MKSSILVAENDSPFRTALAKVLVAHGYEVREACNYAEACTLLLAIDCNVILAIIDVRLDNDADTYDLSGRYLAEDIRFQHIPKIVLTNYRISNEDADALIALRPERLPPAIFILTKPQLMSTLYDAPTAPFSEFQHILEKIDYVYYHWASKLLHLRQEAVNGRSRLYQQMRRELMELLWRLPVAQDPESLSVLLHGIPHEVLKRNRSHPQADLDGILEQLDALGQLSSGKWPLLIFLDNACIHAKGYEIEHRIKGFRDMLEAYYRDYAAEGRIT